ncbi:hypothetical protein ACFWOT_37185 [Streptomyces sp. NPDC058440]|uniref:hypothetical protein n=1 Tax=Streptomyces sp. NPDC058440 TaxID=3346501 RepID=UPI0036661A49
MFSQDCSTAVVIEFVVGEQPQHGLVVVGRGEGGCGRVQPVGAVVLVADPGEFERVQCREGLGDRGVRCVRVAGEGGQRGDPLVLVVPLEETGRSEQVGAFGDAGQEGAGRAGDDGGLFQCGEQGAGLGQVRGVGAEPDQVLSHRAALVAVVVFGVAGRGEQVAAAYRCSRPP